MKLKLDSTFIELTKHWGKACVWLINSIFFETMSVFEIISFAITVVHYNIIMILNYLPTLLMKSRMSSWDWPLIIVITRPHTITNRKKNLSSFYLDTINNFCRLCTLWQNIIEITHHALEITTYKKKKMLISSSL